MGTQREIRKKRYVYKYKTTMKNKVKHRPRKVDRKVRWLKDSDFIRNYCTLHLFTYLETRYPLFDTSTLIVVPSLRYR